MRWGDLLRKKLELPIRRNLAKSRDRDCPLMSYTQLIHYIPILLGTFLFSQFIHIFSSLLLLNSFICSYCAGLEAFTGFVGYRLEYNQRKAFLLDYQVEVSRRKQREILNTMLPAFIVDQMLNCTITKDGYIQTISVF